MEFTFAASLILELGVQVAGTVGMLFVAQLWLPLYRAT